MDNLYITRFICEQGGDNGRVLQINLVMYVDEEETKEEDGMLRQTRKSQQGCLNIPSDDECFGKEIRPGVY